PQSAAVTDHVAGQARWVIGQDQQVELLRAGAGDQVDLLYLVAADAGDLYQLPLKEAAVQPALAVYETQRVEQLAEAGTGVDAVTRVGLQRQGRIRDARDVEIAHAQQALLGLDHANPLRIRIDVEAVV